MNKTICWMCDKEFEYEDPKYRDAFCTHCGVMNSVYDPAKSIIHDTPKGEYEGDEEMPNIGDLNQYLTAMDVMDGDIVTFKDAGKIEDRDFSREQDGSDTRSVLDITVELPDGKTKLFTPNKTSRDALGEAWTGATEKWVGKQAIVEIVKQNVRGTMKKVIYLKPRI